MGNIAVTIGWKSILAAVAVVVGLGACATPASAQATRTWVSGVGDDVNPCSRTAPCKTFAGAIAKTAAGGEINCLDAGGYGAVTITKSIAIICDTVEAGVLVLGTPGITINGANIVVTLSGLDIDGIGSGTDGIAFLNGASLVLDNVKIRSFTNFGIRFEPTAAATLTVRNTTVSNSGTSGTALSGAILIRPANGISGRVVITNSQFLNNINLGVRAETQTGSTINVVMTDSTVSNSGAAVLLRAIAGTGTLVGTLVGNTVANNNFGIAGNGPGASLQVSDTTVASNTTGLGAFAGSTLASFGDNRVIGNGTNGAFTTTIAKQ